MGVSNCGISAPHYVEIVCLECGTVIEPDTVFGAVRFSDLNYLKAAHAQGNHGDAATFKFPQWGDLGDSVGPTTLIHATGPRTRIDDWRSLPQSILEATIVRRLGIPKSHDAVTVSTYIGGPAVVIHPGIARKFYLKNDAAHLRFVPIIPLVLRHPVEVWRDIFKGSEVYRFIGKFRVGARVSALVVSVGVDDRILRTGYELWPHQIANQRKGRFLHAGWAA